MSDPVMLRVILAITMLTHAVLGGVIPWRGVCAPPSIQPPRCACCAGAEDSCSTCGCTVAPTDNRSPDPDPAATLAKPGADSLVVTAPAREVPAITPDPIPSSLPARAFTTVPPPRDSVLSRLASLCVWRT